MLNFSKDEMIDWTGKIILPICCDSHTQIVFAANREQEFVDIINGFTNEEFANNGGGILNSANKLQVTTFNDLCTQSAKAGSITKGRFANFIISKEIPSYGFIPFRFGFNLIE